MDRRKCSRRGGSRHYKLWLPSTVRTEQPSPLLVLLHGCTHDAEAMAEISGMNAVAEANRFLVVYPEQSMLANLLKCWNWSDPKHQERDSGEPSVVAGIVEQVCSARNVDRDRIYVAGVSAGGAMAVIMGATYPDIFSGIAVCAGAEFKAATGITGGFAVMKEGGPDPVAQGQAAFKAMRPGLARKARNRMPVIVFHGTADTRVHPINADQITTQWSTTNARLAAHPQDAGFALSEKIDIPPDSRRTRLSQARLCRRLRHPRHGEVDCAWNGARVVRIPQATQVRGYERAKGKRRVMAVLLRDSTELSWHVIAQRLGEGG